MPSHLGGLSFGLVSHDADMDCQGTVEGGTINHTTQPLCIPSSNSFQILIFFAEEKKVVKPALQSGVVELCRVVEVRVK